VAVPELARALTPRSLIWATEFDVLPPNRVLRRGHGYIAVRSPANPTHWWGNLLLFDRPPGPGDGERWEERFDAEFGDDPRVRHRALAWDALGELGDAEAELVARGYRIEHTAGLVATPGQLRSHALVNNHVLVRTLEPAGGAAVAPRLLPDGLAQEHAHVII